MRGIVLGLISVLNATPATAATPVESQTTLPAEGVWAIHRDGYNCVAQREYGSGRNAYRLEMSTRPGAGYQSITLNLPGNTKPVKVALGSITLQPSGERMMQPIVDMPQQRGFRKLSLWGISDQQLSKATAITFDTDDTRQLTLMLGGINLMQQGQTMCADAIVRGWGLSLQGAVAPAQVEALDPASWFGPVDFPASLYRGRGSGHLMMLLVLDDDGAVGDCRILESSGAAKVDKAACATARAHGRLGPGGKRWMILSAAYPVDYPVAQSAPFVEAGLADPRARPRMP